MKIRLVGWVSGAFAIMLSLSAQAQTTINNEQTISGLSGASGNQRFYKITVPVGQDKLTFETWGGPGNCDLYVRLGSTPSTGSYNARSTSGNNADLITINKPAAGTWHILLHAKTSYSGASIRASYVKNTVITDTIRNGRLASFAYTINAEPNNRVSITATLSHTDRGAFTSSANVNILERNWLGIWVRSSDFAQSGKTSWMCSRPFALTSDSGTGVFTDRKPKETKRYRIEVQLVTVVNGRTQLQEVRRHEVSL